MRTHIIGVGAAKSGTHSLASVFKDVYRSAHEAEASASISHIMARLNGEDRAALAISEYIVERQRRLRLEADISQLNAHMADVFVSEFPTARFILTVRDPVGFLDSITRHSVNRGLSSSWGRWREARFGGHKPPPIEAPLTERGLYSLRGYLKGWVDHHNRVLGPVPKERLLVVRTEEIGSRLADIAQFAGVKPSTLRMDQSHAFPGVGESVLHLVPKTYVDDLVEDVAGAMWVRLKQLAADPPST